MSYKKLVHYKPLYLIKPFMSSLNSCFTLASKQAEVELYLAELAQIVQVWWRKVEILCIIQCFMVVGETWKLKSSNSNSIFYDIWTWSLTIRIINLDMQLVRFLNKSSQEKRYCFKHNIRQPLRSYNTNELLNNSSARAKRTHLNTLKCVQSTLETTITMLRNRE